MTLLYVLAALLVLVGLAGIILPAIPGIPLVFAGLLLAAFAGGFAQVGAGTLIALAVLGSILKSSWVEKRTALSSRSGSSANR